MWDQDIESMSEWEYYDFLCKETQISSMWNTLQSKSEYGSSRSEKGFQGAGSLAARRIARAVGGNADLTEALYICRASFFPINGHAGLDFVMDYLQSQGIKITRQELAVEFIKYKLNDREKVVNAKVEALLNELFAEEEPVTLEVQIVRVCYDTIEAVKRIVSAGYDGWFGKFVYDTTEKLVAACEAAGKPVLLEELTERLKTLPEETVTVSEEKKEVMRSILQYYMERQMKKGRDGMDWLYRYISAPDVSER